jgi:hypothetical protein
VLLLAVAMGTAACQMSTDDQLDVIAANPDLPKSRGVPGERRFSQLGILRSSEAFPTASSHAEAHPGQNGQHRLQWKDGATYTGAMLDGKMHGFGKWTSSNETMTYEGQWLQDQWHGRGTQISLDVLSQYTYIGDFKHGDIHGKGTMKWADGRIYEGEWRAGERHGHGLYVDHKGRQKLGHWSCDKYLGLEEATGCIAKDAGCFPEHCR